MALVVMEASRVAVEVGVRAAMMEVAVTVMASKVVAEVAEMEVRLVAVLVEVKKVAGAVESREAAKEAATVEALVAHVVEAMMALAVRGDEVVVATAAVTAVERLEAILAGAVRVAAKVAVLEVAKEVDGAVLARTTC